MKPHYNAEATANFSSELLPVTILNDAKEYKLAESTVVINLASTPVEIQEDFGGYIPSVGSTILSAGTCISGDRLLLISAGKQLNEDQIRSLGWEDFYGSTADGSAPVLLKSPQENLGSIELSTAQTISDATAPAAAQPFEIKVNLWFSPAGTDCGIHREHQFIETHTQVMGIGQMQKFRANALETIYEDQQLAPGQTQASMFGRWKDGGFMYPWHQYRADSDSIWLAIEYHQL